MANQQNAPLPEGLEIGGYRIVRKISSGGFSMVYLAHDGNGEAVAIKEYLPSTLVTRTPGELVPTVRSEHLPTYRNGLKCFFEEGRALSKVFHPSIVRVLNFFRANETVYMVMAYEEGRSLQELIVKYRNRPGREVLAERHIRRVFAHVMNGLREVHAKRMLHLDLKPANVYLKTNGHPILLDFGAARQTLSVDAPKLFPMYTPGFAAPELYRKNQQLGPWTDIYGLGASMYACLIGMPPQPSDQRNVHDKVDAALQGVASRYSQQLLDLVHWCMKLDPLERPQSLFSLQRALRETSPPRPEKSVLRDLSRRFSIGRLVGTGERQQVERQQVERQRDPPSTGRPAVVERVGRDRLLPGADRLGPVHAVPPPLPADVQSAQSVQTHGPVQAAPAALVGAGRNGRT